MTIQSSRKQKLKLIERIQLLSQQRPSIRASSRRSDGRLRRRQRRSYRLVRVRFARSVGARVVSRNLRRLEALETATSGERMHCIPWFAGQTPDQALASYENDNGPVGPDDGGLLLVYIRKPLAAA